MQLNAVSFYILVFPETSLHFMENYIRGEMTSQSFYLDFILITVLLCIVLFLGLFGKDIVKKLIRTCKTVVPFPDNIHPME